MNQNVFQADMKSLQAVRDMQELIVTFASNELELTGHTPEAAAMMVSVIGTAQEVLEYIDKMMEAMVERASREIGLDMTFLGEEDGDDFPTDE